MPIRAKHSTTYLYSEPVSICHTETRLAPREDRCQHTLEHHLSIHRVPNRILYVIVLLL